MTCYPFAEFPSRLDLISIRMQTNRVIIYLRYQIEVQGPYPSRFRSFHQCPHFSGLKHFFDNPRICNPQGILYSVTLSTGASLVLGYRSLYVVLVKCVPIISSYCESSFLLFCFSQRNFYWKKRENEAMYQWNSGIELGYNRLGKIDISVIASSFNLSFYEIVMSQDWVKEANNEMRQKVVNTFLWG